MRDFFLPLLAFVGLLIAIGWASNNQVERMQGGERPACWQGMEIGSDRRC